MRRYGRRADEATATPAREYEVRVVPVDEARQALRLCRVPGCSHWSARGAVVCSRCGAAL
jgi:hypothetical protein